MSTRTACIKRGGCPTSIDFQEFEFDHMRRAVFSCGECEQTTEKWQQSGESVNASRFGSMPATAFIFERNRTACARLASSNTAHCLRVQQTRANTPHQQSDAAESLQQPRPQLPLWVSLLVPSVPDTCDFRCSEAPPCRIPWTIFSNGAAARDSLAADAAFQVRIEIACCGWRVDLCLCVFLSASLRPQFLARFCVMNVHLSLFCFVLPFLPPHTEKTSRVFLYIFIAGALGLYAYLQIKDVVDSYANPITNRKEVKQDSVALPGLLLCMPSNDVTDLKGFDAPKANQVSVLAHVLVFEIYFLCVR